MKKKLVGRIASFAAAAVLCAGSAAMFAGCTTKHPKVTITYTFDGENYAVTYILSRYDAPKTVQHFIELADAGYYDGLCIHDYDSNHLYSGGYTIEDGELVEKDYFTEVKRLEEAGSKFTQSVWINQNDVVESSPIYSSAASIYSGDQEYVPAYTVYGEFTSNGNTTANGREYSHSYGALVMYYNNKGDSETTRVTTLRNDKGADNDGDKYDTNAKYYKYNSATSLFYTFTGASDSNGDGNYAVFGMVEDADDLEELLDAIEEYIEDHTDEDATDGYSFTDENYISNINQYDPVETARNAKIYDTYDTPIDAPIIIKSVKVNKY